MHPRILLLALYLLALCAPSCRKKSKTTQPAPVDSTAPAIDSNCTITQRIDVEDDSFTYRFEYTNGVLSAFTGASMMHEHIGYIQRSGDTITAHSWWSARSGGGAIHSYDTLHLDKDGFVLWKDSWSGGDRLWHTKVVYTYDGQHQLLKEVSYGESGDTDSIVYTWNNGDCILETSSAGYGGYYTFYADTPAYYGDPIIFQSWIDNFGARTLNNKHALKTKRYSTYSYYTTYTYKLENGKLNAIITSNTGLESPSNIYSYNCQ